MECHHIVVISTLCNDFQFLTFIPSPTLPAGVEPVKAKEWSADSLAWFKDHVLDNNFFALKLLEVGNHSCITLLDTSSGQTVDVRVAMKEAGFAEFHT